MRVRDPPSRHRTADRRYRLPHAACQSIGVSRSAGHGWNQSAWGTGANIEAKLLMLEHAFERLGCMRVEFKTDSRNERSRSALEKLPARFEGIFRRHMIIEDVGVRNSAFYSVTDEDWPTVRINLEQRLAAARA